MAAAGCGGDESIDAFRAIAVPEEAPSGRATTCELLRSGTHERALLPLLVFTVPETTQSVEVKFDRVELEGEDLEVEDVSLYRQFRSKPDLEGSVEAMPLLGYPLDDQGLLPELRRDFGARSLPATVRLEPGQTYGLMAAVRPAVDPAEARSVGYLRATAVHYEVGERRGTIGGDQLGLEGHVVVAEASDRTACDDIEPGGD